MSNEHHTFKRRYLGHLIAIDDENMLPVPDVGARP
jgi:hypothetical protein